MMIYGSDIDKTGWLHTKEFLSEWLHGLVNIFCSVKNQVDRGCNLSLAKDESILLFLS